MPPKRAPPKKKKRNKKRSNAKPSAETTTTTTTTKTDFERAVELERQGQDAQAAALFRSVADREMNAQAQCSLGMCLYAGRGVEENKEEGMQYLRRAADQGLADAQCALASALEEKNDNEEAVALMFKAAGQGHPAALFRMAGHHLEGFDPLVEKNEEAGVFMLEQAAQQGYGPAQEALRKLYPDKAAALRAKQKRADRCSR